MFGEFVWWQGVVEDVLDPLKLGRCRVRVLGYHTDNKQEGVGIPTEHLPWATPVQPITSAAMNGIGTTPMGPVEGTWVFGFFRDGENAQEPVMMGTFGGIPQEVSNPSKGFNDPYGVYPLSSHINEPDVNRLARGGGAIPVPLKGSLTTKSAEDSPSLDHKRKSRTKGVPTGVAGDMSTTIANTDDSAFYGFSPWNEPNPRYGGTTDSSTEYLDSVAISSIYPYNHVRMSESGHVEEWDDTPSAERMHRYHKTGTFEEIQPDGTKVVKVVGSDYEIVLKDKDVLINGTCNVTIGGDCRMLYQGSLVQEIYGDYHLNVHGDVRTKIGGNQATEVFADRKTVINGNDDLFVAYDQILNIGDERTINIGSEGMKQDGVTPKTGNCSETITGDLTEITHGTMLTATGENTTLISVKDIDITALGNMGISTNGGCNITVTGAFNKKISGAAIEHYGSTLDETHTGHYKLHTLDDTSVVAASGKTDHSCPTTRNGSQSCNTAAGIS